MDDCEDLLIGDRTWKNSLKPIEQDGYREGHEDGKKATFQKGFDAGYKEGFEAAFKLAFQNGEIRVLKNFEPSNACGNLSLNPETWRGNCKLCRSQENSS